MKSLLKKTMVCLLVFVMSMTTIFSKETAKDLFEADVINQLDKIYAKIAEAEQWKDDITRIENRLRHTAKGQMIYLQFQQIAKTAVIVGIVIGSYKAHFPPGLRAMASSYLTAFGLSHGLVKLNDLEIRRIVNMINGVKLRIQLSEEQLSSQMSYYCSKGVPHFSCEQSAQ